MYLQHKILMYLHHTILMYLHHKILMHHNTQVLQPTLHSIYTVILKQKSLQQSLIQSIRMCPIVLNKNLFSSFEKLGRSVRRTATSNIFQLNSHEQLKLAVPLSYRKLTILVLDILAITVIILTSVMKNTLRKTYTAFLHLHFVRSIGI